MTTHETTGISVYGSGRVAVEPDKADLQLATSRTAAAPSDAFQEARQAVQDVRSALVSAGISEDHIQVSRLRLSAVYDYSNNRQRLTGHEASADITVAIKDVNATDTVISAAIDAGANAVQALVFDTTRRAELEEAARRSAVADALAKAAVFADAAGVSVGAVVHIEEGAHNGPGPMAGKMLMAESAGPAFVSGSIDIETTVRLMVSINAS